MDTYINGFLISITLIVAIGSQNAYVLRQGLRQNHILWVASLCFILDFLLIAIGIWGVGVLINNSITATNLLSGLGAVFLFVYGLRAFYNAYHSQQSITLDSKDNQPQALTPVILTTLAVTLLNPHAYIDTVVIIGGIAGNLDNADKVIFMFGALTASFVWFYSLGYGARLLAPLFKSPKTWSILDTIIGIIMWYIAYRLLLFIQW